MTPVLVSAETVLLVLVLVLLAGVLRSHAEILRRLSQVGDGALPAPSERATTPGRPAPELAGLTPGGDPVHLAFAGAAETMTLLAFLSTGCGTCAGFWSELEAAPLPAGVEVVAVVHDANRESPARLAELAPPGVPVVMSSSAWRDYAVPGAPYFVLVSDTVLGEGTASGWTALSSLVGDALRDVAAPPASDSRRRSADDTLTAAGIGPGHPSLYPSAPPPAS